MGNLESCKKGSKIDFSFLYNGKIWFKNRGIKIYILTDQKYIYV